MMDKSMSGPSGAPMDSDEMDMSMDSKISEASQTDDEMYNQIAPVGTFSKGALNSLVKSLNAVLPMFSIKDVYPSFEKDATVFPTDFVRQLSMIQKAVEDASEADVIGRELTFSLSDITDDRSISLVAAKLDRISKDRDFKRFLSSPKPEAKPEMKAPESESDRGLPEGSDKAIDMMFLNRV